MIAAVYRYASKLEKKIPKYTLKGIQSGVWLKREIGQV
jgi:hypothetical protein